MSIYLNRHFFVMINIRILTCAHSCMAWLKYFWCDFIFWNWHKRWFRFLYIIITGPKKYFLLRFYCPVNPMGSCRARSVYLTTRLLGRLSPLSPITSIVYILSPETDNCPSWISGRERMTVENISWSISTKECCQPRRGLNPRPPGL